MCLTIIHIHTYFRDVQSNACKQLERRECASKWFRCEGASERFVQAGDDRLCDRKIVVTTSPPNTTANTTTITTISSQTTKNPTNIPTTFPTLPPSPDNLADSRFWITLWSTMVTACLVGACAMHAFMAYGEGKRIVGRVQKQPQN